MWLNFNGIILGTALSLRLWGGRGMVWSWQIHCEAIAIIQAMDNGVLGKDVGSGNNENL